MNSGMQLPPQRPREIKLPPSRPREGPAKALREAPKGLPARSSSSKETKADRPAILKTRLKVPSRPREGAPTALSTRSKTTVGSGSPETPKRLINPPPSRSSRKAAPKALSTRSSSLSTETGPKWKASAKTSANTTMPPIAIGTRAVQKIDTPHVPNYSQEKLVGIMKDIIEDLGKTGSKKVTFEQRGKAVFVTRNGTTLINLKDLVKKADISNLKIDKELSNKFSDFLNKEYGSEGPSKAKSRLSESPLSQGLTSGSFPFLTPADLKAAPEDLLLHIFYNQALNQGK